MPKCPHCDDCFWVCENHETLPWDGDRACKCGGAGSPCKLCNPCEDGKMPRELAGSTMIWTLRDGLAH